MRAVQSLVALSLLVAGCGLFKSEPGSSGANAPAMYGAGPAVPGGGTADASGAPLDATSADGAADRNVPWDAAYDLGGSTPDTLSHADDRKWIRFPPASYSFTQCTWLTKDEGFCNDVPTLLAGTVITNLYRTSNQGKSWSFVCTIDTEMPDIKASINIYVLSQLDFWFTTAAANSGTIGRSLDGGKRWISLTNDISKMLTPAGDAGIPTVPMGQMVAQSGTIWVLPQGTNLAFSPDGGVSWKKFTPPADFGASGKRALLASKSTLLLQYLASDGSLRFYRWNGSAFLPAEASLPVSSAGSHAGTWSRAWPYADGVFFADQGPLPAWRTPFAAYASVDGAQSVLKLLPGASGASDVLGLSDGLAFSSSGALTAYVSGIFGDATGGRFLEIRRTQDAGMTWTTLHSQPSYPGDASYIALSSDVSNTVHAMHFVASTDGIGPPVIYDAHYAF